ncbi:MAG: putative DNA binding domain-containing protein [Candidatus Aminicenantes bacterium]|nr:putative DNA binding domain-containing protein [Candidatus Aminicenantes bacterium]
MKESQNIEFKISWADECLKIVSAFANSNGGKIYIGMDDKGKPIGIKNAKKLLEDIPNKIRNKLQITSLVNLEKRDKRDVIIIDILPSSFPVFYEGKIFIRSGATTQELTGVELSSFLLDKTGNTWDKLPSDADESELDKEAIEKFIALSENRLPLIKAVKDIKLLLQNLQLYTKDGKLTRGAVLLFGKDPQFYFPTAYTKVGRFKTETDILDTVIVNGNLFAQLDRTLEAIKKHISVKFDTRVKDFTLEGLSRRDIWEYPLDALREAVINALIHRDYLGTAPIQIKIFDDKVEFWNLGKLMPPLTPDDLRKPHQANQRNPQIASIFYYTGLIESWGSGTIKMINLCKENGLPEPEFVNYEQGIGAFSVIFYKDIYTEENLRKMGLNERQIKAVRYAKEKGKITNKDYREITGLSDEGARLDLMDLVNKHIFKVEGKGRNIRYVLR